MLSFVAKFFVHNYKNFISLCIPQKGAYFPLGGMGGGAHPCHLPFYKVPIWFSLAWAPPTQESWALLL